MSKIYKLTIVTTCVVSMMLISGCLGGGGSSGASGGYVSGEAAAVDVVGGAGDSGTGDSGSYSDPGVDISHSPEPATIFLLGSGLGAYALLKRKKKESR